MSRLRVVFMGTPDFACPTLQLLIDRDVDLVAVVTQPDRPRGRGQKMLPPPVKQLAEKHGIQVFQPLKVRAPEFIEIVRGLKPDLIVVIAFGQILPKALLDIPVHCCINVHASLLPRYRGAAPINWCIINGETETGITTMLMDVGLDTGDMLLKKTTPIDPEENAQSLHDRLSLLGAEALGDTLDLLQDGRLVPEKQDDALSCYAPMLKKEDGAIDWSRSPAEIKNLVRGMNPWPGTFTTLDGKVLKIFSVTESDGSGPAGSVLKAAKGTLEVACETGSILIKELQLEGKKRLPVAEFLSGFKIDTGVVLGKEIHFD